MALISACSEICVMFTSAVQKQENKALAPKTNPTVFDTRILFFERVPCVDNI